MHLLDLLTILCAGLMTGNELCRFSLRQFRSSGQLEDRAQMRALSLFARLLGKVMPFWYFSCLVLLGLEAYLAGMRPRCLWLLAAVILWLRHCLHHLPARAHQQPLSLTCKPRCLKDGSRRTKSGYGCIACAFCFL